MPDKLNNPIIVDFPLRGEWFAPNTPGKRVPSHGIDQLGQRYAYDFMKVKWVKNKRKLSNRNTLLYLLFGSSLRNWYGYGQKVHAPCEGEIVKVMDGLKERRWAHFLSDLFVVLCNAMFFDPKKHDLQKVTGNYIIMKTEHGYALFAHFKTNSICVKEGQNVQKSDVLGKVGHSGNSTAPHLHFHLMDGPDPFIAAGLPCAFTNCEMLKYGEWKMSARAIPGDKDRIRSID